VTVVENTQAFQSWLAALVDWAYLQLQNGITCPQEESHIYREMLGTSAPQCCYPLDSTPANQRTISNTGLSCLQGTRVPFRCLEPRLREQARCCLREGFALLPVARYRLVQSPGKPSGILTHKDRVMFREAFRFAAFDLDCALRLAAEMAKAVA